MTNEQAKQRLVAILNEQRKFYDVPENDRSFRTVKKFVEDATDLDAAFIVLFDNPKIHLKAANLTFNAFIGAMAEWVLSYAKFNSKGLSWDEIVAKIQLEIMRQEKDENEKD